MLRKSLGLAAGIAAVIGFASPVSALDFRSGVENMDVNNHTQFRGYTTSNEVTRQYGTSQVQFYSHDAKTRVTVDGHLDGHYSGGVNGGGGDIYADDFEVSVSTTGNSARGMERLTTSTYATSSTRGYLNQVSNERGHRVSSFLTSR